MAAAARKSRMFTTKSPLAKLSSEALNSERESKSADTALINHGIVLLMKLFVLLCIWLAVGRPHCWSRSEFVSGK